MKEPIPLIWTPCFKCLAEKVGVVEVVTVVIISESIVASLTSSYAMMLVEKLISSSFSFSTNLLVFSKFLATTLSSDKFLIVSKARACSKAWPPVPINVAILLWYLWVRFIG